MCIKASFMYLASIVWNNPITRIRKLNRLHLFYWYLNATFPVINASVLDDKLPIRESSSRFFVFYFDYAAINTCYIYYLNFTIISAIACAVQKKFCQSELIITSVLIY